MNHASGQAARRTGVVTEAKPASCTAANLDQV